MQPLLGRLEPRLEAVALPALGLDQHNPCGLHEQDTQVATAAFRYLAEDGAVAGRDLLGDEPQPGGEVAAFRERIAGADCGHHRAGDDWPNPRHAHQAFTADIPTCKSLDLARQTLDALIEPAPVAGQVLEHPHHARRQDIAGHGENAWQLSAQEAQALPHGNAALQQEGADLMMIWGSSFFRAGGLPTGSTGDV